MMRCLLLLLAYASRVCESRDLAIFAYVPEYRFSSVNWRDVCDGVTHLVMFSVQPTADGDLRGFDALGNMFKPGSPLRQALQELGPQAPRILFTIGGAGRSEHFAEAVASGKSRKRLAKLLATVFEKLPFIAGVDLDWESPQNQNEWRDLGKLVKDIRNAAGRQLIVTTTYHPRSGAIEQFANVKSKSGSKFVDYFDYIHAMAYTHFDPDRKHSTAAMDRAAIEEWYHMGLPLDKLTLGVPFFGVQRKSGEAKGYSSIIDTEPSLADRVGIDESKDGTYFVNARSMSQKVQMASKRGLGGVMIWEIGQDKPFSSGASLLQNIQKTVREGRSLESSLREMILTQLHAFGEDQAISVFSIILGAVMLVKVMTATRPRDLLQPEPLPPKPSRAKASEPSEGKPDASSAPAEGDGDKAEDNADS